jgi:hypothetical protein
MMILILIIVYLFQRVPMDGKTKEVINIILFVGAVLYFLFIALTESSLPLL